MVLAAIFLVWHYPRHAPMRLMGKPEWDHIVAGMDWLEDKENFPLYYNTPQRRF